MRLNKLLVVLLPALLSSLIVKAQPAVTNDIITVHCDADTAQSYSLYLPPGYDHKKLYPAIFLFDPFARGSAAVSVFKDAARECGFIVAASNNSRNGPMRSSMVAANAMFTDVFKKHNIDSLNVYLGGLSGGARLATAIATNANGIAGVIACCAGFSGPPPATQLSWTFAGITGDRDFNYEEMQQTHQFLKKTQSKNELLLFNGRHGWPPPKVVYEALLWLYLQHAKRNSATDSLFSKFKLLTDGQPVSVSPLIETRERYKNMLSINPDDRVYKQKLAALEASEAFKEEVKSFDKIESKERQYQEKISLAFRKITGIDTVEIESTRWWKNELTGLNKLLLTRTTTDSNYVARQKDYINANAASEYENYYSAKKYKEAQAFLNICLVFDNDNPFVYYDMALIAAANNDRDNTILYLDTALKKGYKNKGQLNKEPMFGFLSTNEKFQALLK